MCFIVSEELKNYYSIWISEDEELSNIHPAEGLYK